MGRFDDQRQAQFLGCRNTIVFAAQHAVTRGWNTQAVPHLLGAQLVHGQCRREDAAAGVRNTQALQQALHAAVFTATAVQNDEGTVDLLGLQAGEEIVAHIDSECIYAGALQRLEHGIAGLERDLALSAFTAEQHGHTAEVGRRDGREQGAVVSDHFDFPFAAANSGLASSLGARPPISPAPWHSRMSPARSSGLTIGARSTPRSM
ncbi:hypothetical protein [Pseudomonas sp. 22 E 5]|nr:hypothetical protein [Pseudomonas sp. 22 E 5]